MTVADPFAEWSRRHGGYDVSRSVLVRLWLRLVHRIARPLASRGAPPDAITCVGVLAAVVATRVSARRAVALVAASAVLDGVDGAVAVRRSLDTRHGSFVDHTADRICDWCYAFTLRRAGAARPVATAAVVSSLSFEAARGVLRMTGRGEVRRATAGDRPMRIAAVVVGLLMSPTLGAAALTVVSTAGIAQLAATADLSGRGR